MKQLLLDSKIDDEKIGMIPNRADTDNICPVPPQENVFLKRHNLQSQFVVMYSGNLGLTQWLEDFVQAEALLQDDTDVQFVFVCRGARREPLERQVNSIGLENVLFLDYSALEQLAHSLSAADLHLLPLNKDLSQCLMPSKLYGILAAGRPYLTTAPQGCELFKITQNHKVGLTVPLGNPRQIADAIRRAKSDPKQLQQLRFRARDLAESRFTRKKSIATFASVVNDCIATKSQGSRESAFETP